jgi:hypothetical protein
LQGARAPAPLAVDLDASARYSPPTEPRAPLAERTDSLISLRTDRDEDYAQPLFVRGPVFVKKPRDLDDVPTIEELKAQVWIYARKRCGPDDGRRVSPLAGVIEGGRVIPVDSRGRRRLLRIVRAAPHAQARGETPSARETLLLTEKSVCARRLREFYVRGRVQRPAFLETPIALTTADGWRMRRRSRP